MPLILLTFSLGAFVCRSLVTNITVVTIKKPQQVIHNKKVSDQIDEWDEIDN